MTPYFSIIIPLYNKEDFIADTIKSVLNQTFTDFEIIVVNDGSTDNSLKELQSIKDHRIITIQQKNQGVSIARNNGIKNAKGNYITLLDADDEWKPNHLELFYKTIKQFPNGALFCNAYDIKSSDYYTIKATYNIAKVNEPLIIEDYFKASLIDAIGWTSAICFNKNDFYDVGEFVPQFTSGQDLDLLIRFALRKTIVFNPTVTCCYNKTVKNSLSKKNYQEIRYTIVNSFKEEEAQNASLNKYLNLNRYALAMQCKLIGNKALYRKLISEIDLKPLNLKQKTLLRIPRFSAILMKKFYFFLLKNKLYISSFK
ncbi:glycosyltransferase family 2 protein [Algibacter lectus]|uniref:glycosyltransferase family 2 protein n=1 Tax=Algibacter lectus TaxID=221126 RepID=UPI0026EA5F7B|nr:glycosyltransferase family 2 protein [Algibacter lectus]MDO7138314.1 glycosyltransferase family 2 protein [Algibacter lectus]